MWGKWAWNAGLLSFLFPGAHVDFGVEPSYFELVFDI